MDEIAHAARHLSETGGRAILATVVWTRGSTPREVGARMLVQPTGDVLGTIGGGCGEAEVWSEAMALFESGESRVIDVDLLHDEDAEGGRACGGIMTVFLEPLLPTQPS